MPRFSRFITPAEQLQQLTPSTLKRLAQPGTRFVPAANYVAQQDVVVVQSDGRTFTIRSHLPLKRLDLVKDTLIHPLWNPKLQASILNQTSEEFAKFQRKFQSGKESGSLASDELADLAYDENATGPTVAVKVKKQAVVAAGKKKKR